MGTKLDLLINENHSKLNDIDLHILGFVTNNIRLCTKLSISELAKKCSVSTATVLRTAQKLGFSGFSEFKYFLKTDDNEKVTLKVDSMEILNQDIAQTMKMFSQNSHLQEIYEIMDRAQNIYAYGTGIGQRLMLQEFSRCLLNVNKNIILVPATGELKIMKNNMNQNDLLFIASWSGNIDKYRDTLINLEVMGVPMISITNLTNNELSSIAKYNLYFQNSFKDMKLNVTISSYLTLHLVLHLLYDGYVEYKNGLSNR
ncbi:MAG: MurR/RpiR family transcriptional regulator [Traorella sp.]